MQWQAGSHLRFKINTINTYFVKDHTRHIPENAAVKLFSGFR